MEFTGHDGRRYELTLADRQPDRKPDSPRDFRCEMIVRADGVEVERRACFGADAKQARGFAKRLIQVDARMLQDRS